MVFIFIPPSKKAATKESPRETAMALFIVALIVLGFAMVAVLVGPKSGNPPPPIVFWALFTLFAIFALVGFFSWLKWQGEGDAPTEEPPQDSHSGEEK